MTDKRAVKIVRLHKKAIRFITTFGKFFITGACGPEWALRVSQRTTLGCCPSFDACAFELIRSIASVYDCLRNGIEVVLTARSIAVLVRCRRRRRLCALLRLQVPIARVVTALHRVAGRAASPAYPSAQPSPVHIAQPSPAQPIGSIGSIDSDANKQSIGPNGPRRPTAVCGFVALAHTAVHNRVWYTLTCLSHCY